ncbi:MAG TPA: UDP-N-acetylmuramoyl-L-alanyl-D-glutamate--2,6-diaminopimelate ligase [Steroidobacteraceae bacterium]
MSTVAAQRWRPLKALLGGEFTVAEHVEVADLSMDSRQVQPGGAFLACRGRTHHGLEFVANALANGARVVLWEPAAGVRAPELGADVLVVAVPDLAAQAGYIADRFFEAPSARVSVTGITGTNGKSTCAWLLAQALTRCGRPTAYLGTLGAGFTSSLTVLSHTTPDAISVQRWLARLRDAGASDVAMEVSSHALDQHRCAGVRFQVAAFTNLTRDHLDYHGDMAAYGAAKARLFDWPTLLARVINADDRFGAELVASGRAATGSVLTSRRTAPSGDPKSRFLHATHCTMIADGLQLAVRSSWGNATLRSPLLGEFNADNLLTVLGMMLALDIALGDAVEALGQCTAPAGRMQRIGGGALPTIIVDYAHTPDALEQALRAVSAHFNGQVACVFGCGGDRDAGKRAAMGAISAKLADRIVLTDDNPRSENPEAIIAAILAGMPPTAPVTVIHDRAQAIRAALALLGAGDVLLVAGKGHESYQLIGSERRPFSDLAAATAALHARSAA